MLTVNPYLNFNGNTEEAFLFYKSVFGGEFLMVQRFKDTPEASQVPTEVQDKIMHIALPLGKANILMGTDALESMGHTLKMGDNISLSLQVESVAQADTFFEKLSAGGKINIPIDNMSWGDYFGMCTDKFGVQWMISYNPNH